EEEKPNFWNKQASAAIQASLKIQPRITQAKNLILFLGDGFGIPTITATRILKGQEQGKLGPETPLALDAFPYVALSKVHPCHAGHGARVMLGMGLRTLCRPSRGLTGGGMAGKAVGILTTTRVQHASPSGTYAHVVNRNWYADSSMPADALSQGCKDIAWQLVHNVDINVILGGGRKYMTPEGTADPEYPTHTSEKGVRKDGNNLINMWLKARTGSRYAWNRTDMLTAANDPSVKYLMGNKCPMGRDLAASRPAERMEAAITILNRNPNGFYLFVEDKIDHGHHDGAAHKALIEAVEFDRAIERAGHLTDEAQTLTVNYTSILYGNGPGYNSPIRSDVDENMAEMYGYLQQAAVPLESETHGGEDVAILAKGPMAHLFHGVQEQTY
ncbi:Intestinal-type alkaline phosphatase, partial [Podiceps cristatus]